MTPTASGPLSGPLSGPTAPETDPLLRLTNVRKSYGDKVVLADIDLAVKAHEVVCLIGASGSGKSTLLRTVNLLEPIDDGVIEFRGQEISEPTLEPSGVRQRMGMVFQAFNLFPHLTVLDNITLAPIKVHGQSRAVAQERAYELLDRVGLSDKAAAHPDRLSGGQQQRVALARALATDPELLLLDEITAALDPELVGEVLELVRDLAESGTTMVIATHEMNFARDIASRVCFLHEGRIAEQGPPEQMFTHPHQERTRQFLARVLPG
jgi:polar amino acid transport system ATP-binding protein